MWLNCKDFISGKCCVIDYREGGKWTWESYLTKIKDWERETCKSMLEYHTRKFNKDFKVCSTQNWPSEESHIFQKQAWQ